MGLTSASTGTKILEDKLDISKNNCDYTVAFAGNPNVGKSSIFNALTGMHQHTGNWPGKTVTNSSGLFQHNNKQFLLVDLPGTYSLMSHSAEEEIARDYICFSKPDCVVIVVDATCLERNLNLVFQTLEITSKVVICVNLLDEATKKGIHIDLDKLSTSLGVPVVGTIAHKKNTLKKLIKGMEDVCNGTTQNIITETTYDPVIEDSIQELCSSIKPINGLSSKWLALKLIDGNETLIHTIEEHYQTNLHTKTINKTLENIRKTLREHELDSSHFKDSVVSSILLRAETICKDVVAISNTKHHSRDAKIDKVLTSKIWGIPIMLLFLGIIFWITITGANYPSQLLSNLFGTIEIHLLDFFNFLHAPEWITNILVLRYV